MCSWPNGDSRATSSSQTRYLLGEAERAQHPCKSCSTTRSRSPLAPGRLAGLPDLPDTVDAIRCTCRGTDRALGA